MLTQKELASLYRAHTDDPILSVYIDAEEHDPAQRNAWRVRLDQGIRAVRTRLEAEGADASDFESALAALTDGWREDAGFLHGRGWAGFALGGEAIYKESLSVPLPDLVRWERGLHIAPYVGALEQEHSVIAVLLDSRRARVFRYRRGELSEIEDLTADLDFGDLGDGGMRKAGTRHSGVRGQTATDAVQAVLDHATTGFVSTVAERVKELTASDGGLLIGGVAEPVAALHRALPRQIAERTLKRSELFVEMPTSKLEAVVEEAAAELRHRDYEELVEQAVEAAGALGNGTLGPLDTEKALREGRVRVLLIARALRERHPDYADTLLRRAMGLNSAHIHEVSGPSGVRLDAEGKGVAALLHYRPLP